MFAINVLLFLGANALALFVFIFLAGAVIHLVSLVTEGLRATRRSSYLPRPTWLKAAVVVLGVLSAGALAITVADDAAAILHAVTTSAARGVVATPATVATASDEQPSAEHYLPPYPSDRLSPPAPAPRECRPSQGVVTDCTFN